MNSNKVDEKELQLPMEKFSPVLEPGKRLLSASYNDREKNKDNDGCGSRPSPDEETDTLNVGEEDQCHEGDEEEEEEEEEFDDDDDNGLMMLDPVDVIAVGIRDNGLPGPPDGGWGYVIILASFVINMVMDGVTSSFSVLFPQIVDTYRSVSPGVGRSDVAWAGSLLSGVSLCFGPIASALTNKYGCRIVCMVGAVISAVGFAGAAYSPNLELLLVTFGLIGGIGFGMLYLPAIVCVSYYFEKQRARATGIAVSGSGFGTVIFAPLITSFSKVADWRTVCLAFAGLLALLLFAGATMKPLMLTIDPNEKKHPPLLQRMADDKKHYMEKASFAGSTDYFMVQLPDGTMERRLKMSSNVDPGVHSGLYLDQLLIGSGGAEGATPVPPSVTTNVDILPTISETRPAEGMALDSSGEDMDTKQNGTAPRSPGPVGDGFQERHRIPSFGSKSRPKASEPTDIPHLQSGRRRRVSEGEQHQISPPTHSMSWGIPRLFGKSEGGKEQPVPTTTPANDTAADIARKPSFTRSIGRGSSFPWSKGSVAQVSRTSSTDTGIGDGSGILGSIPSPRDRKYSIRAVPTSTSLGRSRKNSLGSSGHFRTSVSNVKGSRREINDDDYKSLPSTSDFSQILRRSSTQKRSIFGDHSHVAHSAGGPDTCIEGDKLILRTMSRRDIFYSGTIHQLEEFQSQSLIGYRQSVLNLPIKRVPTGAGLDEEMGGADVEGLKPRICPCVTRATGSFWRVLAQMMDFSLIRNPTFLVIAISGVIGMLGFHVPIVYAIDFAAKKGIEEKSAAWFISLLGITSAVGRIGFGLVSGVQGVDSFLIYNMCVMIMGLCTCALPLCFDYYLIAALFTTFGLALSGFIALSSIILVKLLGLENLTNAFGLLIFFRGISTVLGTPLSGAIYDATKSYDIPFYLAGSFLLISALISFLGPVLTKCAGGMHVSREIFNPAGGGPLEDILEVVESSSEADAEAETAIAAAGGGTDAEKDSDQQHKKNEEDEASCASSTRDHQLVIS